MLGECACELPPVGKACEHSNTFVPTYLRIRYSTTYNNDAAGYSHGSGRLNSNQAWSAAWPTRGDFMEMDLGEELSVSGVVTQGRAHSPQWVTAYKLQVAPALIYPCYAVFFFYGTPSACCFTT